MKNHIKILKFAPVALCLVLFLSIGVRAYAQSKETEDQKTKRMQWWTDARFGMFIHWGLYSMPARHEWVRNYERISNEQYQKYFELFNPDLFDPHKWAKMAKAAGMKYAVITTKHHEGFCLFDSKFTDYKSVNTPCGKDLLKEWVEAFRAEGLKIGFYYSLIDWHHPDFTVDRNHPLRQDSDSAYDRLNKGRDMKKYREYLKNQVRELLTNYGEVSVLWLDFSSPGKNGKDHNDWDSENLLKMVRQLQPGILVNDRLDLKDVEGGWDFTTPEQVKVAQWPEYKGKRIPWETCQTFSGSWGYYRDEYTWKDPKQLLVLLIESVSKGGNLLLNVGPTSRGTFDSRANDRLKAMGEWMAVNSRSIYNCTQAPADIPVPDNCLLTYNPKLNRLYIHCLDWPMGRIQLKGLYGKVKYAQLLHDGSEVLFSQSEGKPGSDGRSEGVVNLKLPITKPDLEIPVIEIILK
jgi:alpha-L-fucosidase